MSRVRVGAEGYVTNERTADPDEASQGLRVHWVELANPAAPIRLNSSDYAITGVTAHADSGLHSVDIHVAGYLETILVDPNEPDPPEPRRGRVLVEADGKGWRYRVVAANYRTLLCSPKYTTMSRAWRAADALARAFGNEDADTIILP